MKKNNETGNFFLVINEGQFDFNKECKKRKLDPKKTSIHKLHCLLIGLDPEKTNCHELQCIVDGLDPQKTSVHERQCFEWGLPINSTTDELLRKQKDAMIFYV